MIVGKIDVHALVHVATSLFGGKARRDEACEDRYVSSPPVTLHRNTYSGWSIGDAVPLSPLVGVHPKLSPMPA